MGAAHGADLTRTPAARGSNLVKTPAIRGSVATKKNQPVVTGEHYNPTDLPSSSWESGDVPEEEEKHDNEEGGVFEPFASPAGTFESAERDVELVAKTFGWDIHATRQHLSGQEAFSNLVAHAERRYPRAFAGSVYARRPGAVAQLYFRGSYDEVPERLRKAIDGFTDASGVKVELVTDMRHSSRDQERRLDEIEAHFAQLGRPEPDSTVLPGDILILTLPADPDFPPTPAPEKSVGAQKKDEINAVRGDDDPILPPKGTRDIVDERPAKALLPSGFDARGVVFVFTADSAARDYHVRGGRKVYTDTDSSGRIGICTAGFSVYRVSDGRNGVASAAHCDGMKHFDAESPESDFRLYHRAEHNGRYGDMEWKSSGHYELPEYWANRGDLRYVTSQANSFSNNDVHCLYSRMRGARYCDRVYSTCVRQSGAKKLVAMDHNSGVGGDSGGPWSNGSKAAGLVKGAKVIWFWWRDTFSKVKHLNSALGVKILKHS